jgi:hypothetical protein
MDPSELSQALTRAQLQRADLENEKLRRELAAPSKPRSFQFPPGLVPLISAVVSVVGFRWGVFQYTNQQEKNRELTKREFMKPWLESQRDTYVEALSAAAAVANSRKPEDRITAEDKFWQLYHGRMILVETKKVSGAMIAFGDCIQLADNCTTDAMNKNARALATAMAESMAQTSTMSYEEFKANQFRYTSAP